MESLLSDLERNKRVVVDYYQTAFAGNPEKAIADHFGERYIKHNPDAADGPEAFGLSPGTVRRRARRSIDALASACRSGRFASSI